MDKRKLTCMAAAAFASSMLILSTAAFAQPPEGPVVVSGHAQIDPETQRVVPFGDLNLANTVGQKKLIGRVSFAIDDLCEIGVHGNPNSGGWYDSRRCYKTAWESANPQITDVFEKARSGALVEAASLTVAVQR